MKPGPSQKRSATSALVIALFALLATAGCAPVTPTGAPTVAATGAPTVAVPAFSEADVERWMKFRNSFGLRADRQWMLDVARDPSAWSELQIPLLPLEIAMVTQRAAAAVDTVRALEAYGSAFPDEYGGAYLDDGTAVLLMTAGVPQHTAAIARLLPGRRIEVRPVEYALTELNERAEQVRTASAWLRMTAKTEIVKVLTDEVANRVLLLYRATDESVEPAIREHFEDARWLSLDRVGAPAWSGPVGALRPRLLDRNGRPIAGECFLQPLEEGVSFDVLPREIDGRGICDFGQRVPASRYRLEITYDEGRESRRFITEIRVVGGATMEEVIVID